MRRAAVVAGAASLVASTALAWASAPQNCGWACYAPVVGATQHTSGWFVSPWLSAVLVLFALAAVSLNRRRAIGWISVFLGALLVVATTGASLQLSSNLVEVDPISLGPITALAGIIVIALAQLVRPSSARRLLAPLFH